MFNIFNKEDPYRKQNRLEFEAIMNDMIKQPQSTRIAVGHSINIANSMFYQRFSGVDNFMKLKRTEQMDYQQSLNEMQEKLGETDPASMIGFHLFGKWISSLIENDKKLMLEFTKGLAILSEEADIG